jgi:hypothetical protein
MLSRDSLSVCAWDCFTTPSLLVSRLNTSMRTCTKDGEAWPESFRPPSVPFGIPWRFDEDRWSSMCLNISGEIARDRSGISLVSGFTRQGSEVQILSRLPETIKKDRVLAVDGNALFFVLPRLLALFWPLFEGGGST